MNFIKDNWSSEDIKELDNYLDSIKREDKIEWTRKIVNTKMDLYGITNPTLKSIAKNIYKGNYISYLDNYALYNYDLCMIYAYILNLIKDIEIKKKYLLEFSKKVDNWSCTDSLKFKIKNYEKDYLELSNEYIKSNLPFRRRIGVIILFAYKRELNYYEYLFKLLDLLSNEEDYYVNMAIAWLLCELCVFDINTVVKYVKNSKLNNFIKNKFISKCHDSFRIDNEVLDNLYKTI